MNNNIETIRSDNQVIGFYKNMGIIETEDGELHYIDGLTDNLADIGDIVENHSFKSIHFLSRHEQEDILTQFSKNRDPKRLTAAAVIQQCSSQDKELLYSQFLDDFYHAKDKANLIAEEPSYNLTESLFCCDIAATVHKLANDYTLNVPQWVFDKKYIYNGLYYAFDTNNLDFQKHLEETTPPEFKQRNLMVGDTSLKRC